MKESASDPLVQAIDRLRRAFPEWRMGQLVANLLTAAGRTEVESIWDIEDNELLSAARRLLAQHLERHSVRQS